MYLTFSLFPSSLIELGRSALRRRAIVRIRLLAVSAVLASMASASFAQSGFDEEFDDPNKPWQEITVQLPMAPLDENLLPFDVSATASQSFAIDTKSLTAGADGVVRYTMVAKSPLGAKTVSYEGIRCASFEKKLYAFGHPDGDWSRSRRDRWEPIVRNAGNRQHAVLALDYFCENRAVAGNAEKMVERLRGQRPLNSSQNRF